MMVAIAYSDKNRDYTLPQSGVFAMQHASGLRLLQQRFGRILWLFHCFLGVSMLVMVLCSLKVLLDKLPLGIQPCRQAGRSSVLSGPSTFSGQSYGPSSVPAYATSAIPAWTYNPN